MMKKLKEKYWLLVIILAVVLLALILVNILVRASHRASQPEETALTQATLAPSAELSNPETGAPADVPEASTAAETQQPAPSAAAASADEMDRVIHSVTDNAAGSWSVYYESLTDGSSCGVNSSQSMVSASLIKLFIMGAVYQEVEAGTLSHDGVYSDIYSMITVSDNDAANRLVRALGNGDAAAGMEKVNAWAQSIGCGQSSQKRLMLDNNGLQNYVSARDCGTILRMIYAGQCVSQTWSAEMLSCLKAQTVNNRLPAQLPAGTVVAHKTGDLSNLSCGDVGIVYAPQGCYILCVINNQSPNDGQTIQSIAELSVKVYEQFGNGANG